jgi:phytoene dehydrogenase-like protein
VLDLVGAEHFPDEVAQDMRRYRTRGASVKINAVLSEPPRYVNAPAGVSEQLLHASVAICPSVPYLERAWQDAQRGMPAEGPYIEVEVPTAVDPSLTDDGTTVLTMFTQFGPHAAEDWPDGAREAYAQRCFSLLAQHAPNVPDAILHYEVLAPPDLERIFGLEGGSIFQGEQGLDQMAFMRPTPELARYATPVHGLYLCGAGTHPGGGVIAASGRNAAHRALRDLRAERTRARLRHPVAAVRG